MPFWAKDLPNTARFEQAENMFLLTCTYGVGLMRFVYVRVLYKVMRFALCMFVRAIKHVHNLALTHPSILHPSTYTHTLTTTQKQQRQPTSPSPPSATWSPATSAPTHASSAPPSTTPTTSAPSRTNRSVSLCIYIYISVLCLYFGFVVDESIGIERTLLILEVGRIYIVQYIALYTRAVACSSVGSSPPPSQKKRNTKHPRNRRARGCRSIISATSQSCSTKP